MNFVNLSQPIKKIREKARSLYYRVYFRFDTFLSDHVIPYLWDDLTPTHIHTGSLVCLKHKLTLKKYHGIVLNEPKRVITAYGVVGVYDNVRYITEVRWNYGPKTFTRWEFCENLEVISGAK